MNHDQERLVERHIADNGYLLVAVSGF